MLNRFASILMGCVAGIAVIFIIEILSHVIYPIPEGLNPQNAEDLKKIMEMAPAGVLFIVLFGGYAGGFCAGMLSSWMAKSGKLFSALMAGAILTCLGVLNAFMIPHPLWFTIASFFIYFAGAFIGNKLVSKSKKHV